MVPPFDENGNLPPGIHPCTFAEINGRFGKGSPERQTEVKELERFVGWARSAGVGRIIIDGSFATDTPSPNDVDIVILPGPDYPRDQSPVSEEKIVWPFLHILIAVNEGDFEQWALEDFGRDRLLRRRGVLEVTL